MLIRLLDSDEEGADMAHGPRAWSGGWPPAARPDSSSLIAEPTSPDDPLWVWARYGWPRPPFGTTGPVSGWPSPARTWPYQSYPPVNTRGLGTWPAMPLPRLPVDRESTAGAPLPFWLESLAGSPDIPRQPAVLGLEALLARDDDAEDANSSVAAGAPPDGLGSGYAFGREPDANSSVAMSRDVLLAQAGGAPDAQRQNRPSLEYAIDQIEGNFRNIVPGWRKQGLNEAAANLEWYLDGSGETRYIHRDDARLSAPILRAEELNSWRTEDAFVNPRHHAGKLLALKDGQTITINDKWDKDYEDLDFLKQSIDPASKDFALAFGNTKFHTEGAFQVTRAGDEILIEGIVENDWKDRYWFRPDRYLGVGGALAEGAVTLEEHRGAKPFDIKSTWLRRLKGKIQIKDGALTKPVFEWEDE